ncbi:MAG: SGNH/GDSL hydrolase family protein [Lentisphaeria bacterium]|nr:SGNH/GDSL hydrolase family protein [Lentisphaeria bacterium]
MQKLDMEKIDRYMQRKKIDPAGLRWLDPRDGVFEVSGFYWFETEKRYHRFPRKMSRSSIPQAVKTLASCTAGGQLRFRTDSRRIVLSVKTVGKTPRVTMAETGRSGFDLYVGKTGSEIFWDTAKPVSGKTEYVSEIFRTKSRKMREFRLNFPLYNGVSKLSVALEEDARLLPPSPLPVKKPIVIYGTSITQGGCASRPGSAFTNRLSRELQAEFLNFGFSGHGQNDPEAAELLAEVEDPAMYILDSEANSISAEKVRERVPRFLDILRRDHPETPIVIVTKVPYGPRYSQEIPILKEEFRKIYQTRKKAGDRNLYFVDGTDFWAPEDYSENTVDGAHPTDLGFARMAEKLKPVLLKLLQKYGLIRKSDAGKRK